MFLLTIFPYTRPLWSWQVLFRAPTLGLKAQSAAICWTSVVPAANVLNGATLTMNSVPWQTVCAQATSISEVWSSQKLLHKYTLCVHKYTLSTCVSVQCQIENTSAYFLHTHVHTHAYSYQSEYPWRTSQIAMGHTWLCFFPNSPLALLPSSHTGGIWNLLAAESHRAINPSKAHKRTRGRTSNNVGPTSCQQTQCIVNLNKTHCSFFILSVSLYVSLNFSTLSLSHTHTTWE